MPSMAYPPFANVDGRAGSDAPPGLAFNTISRSRAPSARTAAPGNTSKSWRGPIMLLFHWWETHE